MRGFLLLNLLDRNPPTTELKNIHFHNVLLPLQEKSALAVTLFSLISARGTY